MDKKDVFIAIQNQISEGNDDHDPTQHKCQCNQVISPSKKTKETSSYIGIQIKTHCE